MEKFKNIAIVVLLVCITAVSIFCVFTLYKNHKISQRETAARVEAQNRIAELSSTIKEGEQTWSRLAQEREIEVSSLRERDEELSRLIEERNERIVTLTEVNAQLGSIRVVVDRGNVTQTTLPPVTNPDSDGPTLSERIRVEFNQTWEEFMQIEGFTLTNPAEAELRISYTRPVRISFVSTQQEDLSWRHYVSTDIPNLEVGEISGVVNPIQRPHEQTPWYNGIYLGIGASAASSLDEQISGFGFVEFGYDFGDIEFGLMLSTIVTGDGMSLGGGFAIRINPFAF